MLQKQIRTEIKTFGSCFPLPPHLGRLEARLSLIKAELKLKGGPAGLEEVGD